MKQTATAAKARSARKPLISRKLGFGHILAPTDFSEKSVIAVDYAVELSRRLGGRLTLLHIVAELSALDYTMGGFRPGELERAQAEARKKLDQELVGARALMDGLTAC